MNKSIFTLLFLLLLLIVTCVYQKTYTLYAQTTEVDTTVNVVKEAEIQSFQKEQPIKIVDHNVVTAHEGRRVKEPTILEKIKTTVSSVISSNKNEHQTKISPTVETENKIITQIKTMKKPVVKTEAEEKEVVDYLLTVLDERDLALIHRDEAESRLHALIKKALENRRLAIENMHKTSNQIDKAHQKRLKERDHQAQNNTEGKGK
ncbi:hypothetical protein C9926_00945 [Sulfurovum lithotrophicum]|nr:hypothetical protein C9926_00945 [Sulfurovum lithotrophicum]